MNAPYLHLVGARQSLPWTWYPCKPPMCQGFVYLTAIVDVATRRVMAHKVATTLEACHAKEIMQEALARYGTPEIVNTDQGSQFTAEEFTQVVLGSGAKLSMDGRGAWRDNVFVERLWRKREVRACLQTRLRQRLRGQGQDRHLPGLVQLRQAAFQHQ